MLKVNPVLPVALADIEPFVVLPPEVAVVVPETRMVLPAHGSAGVSILLLLQAVKARIIDNISIKPNSQIACSVCWQMFFIRKYSNLS